MPELPDLVYLEKRLQPLLVGRQFTAVEVYEPVVVRMLLPGDFAQTLTGLTCTAVRRHGPFLVFSLSGEKELILHPMLAGRLQWRNDAGQPAASCALTLTCEPGAGRLHYLDDKRMGKIYLTKAGAYGNIPRFCDQGPDLLSAAFSLEYFQQQLRRSRKQVRVLLMDQAVVSCIGNAYADEILFHAGLHPKTFCQQLQEEEITRLYHSIRAVMQWGLDAVAAAQPALEVKVRDHLQVRNRKDQPCPKCGSKIRRAGVLGHDAFFCPTCQPPARRQFLDWRTLDKPRP
ncbi:MAG: DNA-formamidopyrimidine glycosylase [candidate division KSB1 bacterium]|nr:DNA-formamidopyrimidine glycosylase [candidate division KSB1 bacterium]MDZ7275090.1 DNA-formamidopyrimidine glycosylase [candidate division KSB1 bacterium]MDZ7286462.1 DNA-formamidopyrimidine glycosylase [candidate division KSB1 bacterium]MDZ7299374.1 DNA-formamidopyrimidine glycosylase [candidate division KSB1 bacterium]MDZ7306297.1 DNA-formamidopyrimidine glycosylase [candidate division KSB1 bacterium]